ncbi:Prephenate dehydrogenase [Chthoniobacter flavus Ellin428]|uniref:Prephenate dehydrogenase n=1 Tax=Chthoniobacter flavus Ellin428 TaxID=497964 RepID=B4CW53_9BACT|nr:prephenate dehydrogenase/arogenate dehydrogenase family protein [Chthoniobacter flavus]EDY21645.1 Prephenate dehydrogenase [Chthoniobacter flavus Ellin428]TCO95583.1 cyclohexadieny/prephenate dehydrogenase/prephenate dehydrogenase [Chthoniobacter flavus]
MTRLAIIGPGLLGGSIALAARRAAGFHVAVWARRAEAVAELQKRALAEVASTDLAEVVHDADIVVLAVPIGIMGSLARQIASLVPSRAIITDVGSCKGPVVEELSPIFAQRGRFVGSHPMAGSERTGLEAARAGLFDGAACIVTPDSRTDAEAVTTIHNFWQTLGGRVLELSPAEHDEIVAMVSHFPHLLAAALVNLVAEKNATALEFAGPGFRDTTRVASGPPEMWTEILRSNHTAVRASVEAMIEKLREIATLLDHDASMTALLTQAKTQRDQLRFPKHSHA